MIRERVLPKLSPSFMIPVLALLALMSAGWGSGLSSGAAEAATGQPSILSMAFKAFGWGFGTSLTPCVYPMIAITVSVFGARQAKSKAEAAMLSSAFVLGMAVLFTALFTIAGAYGLFCACVYVLLGPLIVRLLTTDHQVAELAERLLWVGAAWQPFGAAYIVGAAVLRGVGDIRYATIAMVIIAWVVTKNRDRALAALGGAAPPPPDDDD